MIINRYKNITECSLRNTIKFFAKKLYVYNFVKQLECQYMSKKAKNYMNAFFNKDYRVPLFKSVEIETINKCNGICPFCPVNKNEDSRPLKTMDENLFLSIINQLKELNYSGSIALFSNNEPFLDNRISSFAKIIKTNLPNTHLYINTNGTLLTLDKFLSIIPYLDKMHINNYNDELKLNYFPQIIHEYCKQNNLYTDKVTIMLRKLDEVLTTRGGQSPNSKKHQTLKVPCVLPYMQIIIRPDGKLSLCCNDAKGIFTLGDLNKHQLIDIWNSVEYRQIRIKLLEGRNQLSLCEFCDTIHSLQNQKL